MGMPSSKKDYSLLREATVDHIFPPMSQNSEKQRKAQKASHKRLWESSETLSGQMLQRGSCGLMVPGAYYAQQTVLNCAALSTFSCLLEALTVRTQLILLSCIK